MQKANPSVYNAAIYIRLSREDKDKPESNSILNQRKLIYSFLKGKEDINVICEKIDDGYSGADFNRPAFIEMMNNIKNGEINCVIVKDLSRFGRNYIETGRYIQQIFPLIGVRFIAINDSFDSIAEEKEAYNIVLPFKNLMNDAYGKDISIKVRSGLEAKKRRGDYVGSFPVFGYKADPYYKNKLVIDEVAAETVKNIFDMRISGHNNKSIAEFLNSRGVPSPMEHKLIQKSRYFTPFKLNLRAIWSETAVSRILKNEMYTGVMVQGKEKTLNYKIKKRIRLPEESWFKAKDTHEAIISRKDFDIVQSLALKDTRTPPGEKCLYNFSGILRCGACGNTMVRRTVKAGGNTYAYFICGTNKKDKALCESHRIREDYLEKAVFFVIKSHISAICSLDETLKEIEKLPLEDNKIKKLKDQIEDRKSILIWNKRLKSSAYEDYKSGLLTEEDYLEMKMDYGTEAEKLKNVIKNLKKELEAGVKNPKPYSKEIEEFKNFGNIRSLNRAIIAVMIEKIIVFDAYNVEIYFKYQDEFKGSEDRDHAEKV